MANKENWEVSFIDEDGAYNGDLIGDVTGNVSGNVTGNVTGLVFGITTEYTTAAPEIAVTDSNSLLDATAQGVSATIGGGTDGQTLTIKCVNADSAVTLIPDDFVDGTTITFDVNETAVLLYNDTLASWLFISGTAAIT